MDRLGLGYEALHARDPRLIYCAISAFGQDGPSRERPGYDVIVQALTGITGTPEGEPVKTGVALTDLAAGLYAFSGILAALYHRERTGEGQRIRRTAAQHPAAHPDLMFLTATGSRRDPRATGQRPRLDRALPGVQGSRWVHHHWSGK